MSRPAYLAGAGRRSCQNELRAFGPITSAENVAGKDHDDLYMSSLRCKFELQSFFGTASDFGSDYLIVLMNRTPARSSIRTQTAAP